MADETPKNDPGTPDVDNGAPEKQDSPDGAPKSNASEQPDAAKKADAPDADKAPGDAPEADDGGKDAGKDAQTPPDGQAKPEADKTPPLSTALNPQIVQAVGTTNHAVLNGAFPGANGVAYQKVAQAAAYAVQDSTDYMRNIMSMASATTGVAMQKMLATKEVQPYSDIIEAATKAVTEAQKTFSSVGESASGVVKDFDNLA